MTSINKTITRLFPCDRCLGEDFLAFQLSMKPSRVVSHAAPEHSSFCESLKKCCSWAPVRSLKFLNAFTDIFFYIVAYLVTCWLVRLKVSLNLLACERQGEKTRWHPDKVITRKRRQVIQAHNIIKKVIKWRVKWTYKEDQGKEGWERKAREVLSHLAS